VQDKANKIRMDLLHVRLPGWAFAESSQLTKQPVGTRSYRGLVLRQDRGGVLLHLGLAKTGDVAETPDAEGAHWDVLIDELAQQAVHQLLDHVQNALVVD